MLNRIARIVLLVAILASGLAVAPRVLAGPESCDTRVNNTFEKLLECMTLEGVRQHQAAFQAIADANNGTAPPARPATTHRWITPSSVFTAAGYDVTVQPFQFQTFIVLSPAILEQVAPPPAGPIANSILSYSGSGDVTAAVSTVNDIRGCNASRFRRLPGRQYRPDQPRHLHFRHQGHQCL